MSAAQDRADYALMLSEAGYAQDAIAALPQGDVLPMPMGALVEVNPSELHGLGLFARCNVEAGEVLAQARIGGARTEGWRYGNHSQSPNAELVLLDDGDVDLKALKRIPIGSEVFIDYRQSGALQGIKFQRPAVPFERGDMHGKRDYAVAMANKELEKVSGIRAQLYKLQANCAELPEAECPLQHVFAPGAVARTIFIPAGTVIVGKIHKHAHLNVLSQGDVSMLTEDGGTERIRGPVTMLSQPGTKRAVFAHTDTYWTTIHLTGETDLKKIEEYVIADSYADYEEFISQNQKLTAAADGV